MDHPLWNLPSGSNKQKPLSMIRDVNIQSVLCQIIHLFYFASSVILCRMHNTNKNCVEFTTALSKDVIQLLIQQCMLGVCFNLSNEYKSFLAMCFHKQRKVLK